jgi:hypothetical protein
VLTIAEEKQFENKVKRFLHSVGVYAAGTPEDKMEIEETGWYLKIWGGGYQKSGIPDLLCCVNGIFIAPELKASKGVASDLQKKNIRMINAGNGIGLVLYPEGFEQFKNIVRGVINCKAHIPELNALKAVNSSTKSVILTK